MVAWTGVGCLILKTNSSAKLVLNSIHSNFLPVLNRLVGSCQGNKKKPIYVAFFLYHALLKYGHQFRMYVSDFCGLID
jgi:hypothetical protein